MGFKDKLKEKLREAKEKAKKSFETSIEEWKGERREIRKKGKEYVELHQGGYIKRGGRTEPKVRSTPIPTPPPKQQMPPQTEFCPWCGERIGTSDFKFCPKCGNDL